MAVMAPRMSPAQGESSALGCSSDRPERGGPRHLGAGGGSPHLSVCSGKGLSHEAAGTRRVPGYTKAALFAAKGRALLACPCPLRATVLSNAPFKLLAKRRERL